MRVSDGCFVHIIKQIEEFSGKRTVTDIVKPSETVTDIVKPSVAVRDLIVANDVYNC